MREPRAALDGLRRLFAGRVDARPGTLADYESATFATSQKILAVVRLRNVGEVQDCLRWAQRTRVPVYPLSCGKNWAYGSRVPVKSGSVVMELSEMRRIHGFDEELGTVRIQPGVTFRQLGAYLQRRGSAWMAPVIASTDEASVLGNALERGLGLGLGGVRAEQTVSLEVVTAGGERLHTGSAALPGARTRDLFRAGLGPSLDGLFFQSNLGVVTEATVWLRRRPKFRGAFEIRVQPSQLPDVLRQLSEALEAGQLQGVVKLTNTTYELVGSYWDWSAKLPPDVRLPRPARPAKEQWIAHLALLGATRAEVRHRLGALRARLDGRVEASREQPVRAVVGPGDDPYLGGYNPEGLLAAYWRHPPPMPATVDLQRDRRGVLFCSVCVPLRGPDVRRAAKLFERTCLRAGFEPAMTFNLVDARAACLVGSLFFNRGTSEEDAAALACHAAALEALRAAGYPPFRLGIQSMAEQGGRTADTERVLVRIRRALDPAGVLAPGRYLGTGARVRTKKGAR